MSFSTDFKKEILNNSLNSKNQKIAFLSAVLRQSGSLHISKKVLNIQVECELYELILRLADEIKNLYDTELNIKVYNDGNLKKTIYTLELPQQITQIVAKDTGLIQYEGDSAVSFLDSIYDNNFDDMELKAFMLGIAVSSANITVPVPSKTDSDVYEGSYSLEMKFNSENIAYEVMEYFAQYDILLKKVERNDSFYLYLRESEMICDFMAFFGGSNAVIELNNIIVSRSVRNKTNRERNCVIANIDKSVMAGQKQYLAIKKIDEKIGLDKLSDKLRELAKIRLENPDLTLDQIAELVGGGISKSGINHRFRKIMEIANSLNE